MVVYRPTYTLVTLNAFRHLFEVVVVSPVDVSKVADLIPGLQACDLSWAAFSHRVDLGEWLF